MTFLSQFNFVQFYQLNLNPVILGEIEEKILFFLFHTYIFRNSMENHIVFLRLRTVGHICVCCVRQCNTIQNDAREICARDILTKTRLKLEVKWKTSSPATA